VEGSCEHNNEPSSFIKHWEILEYLSDLWLPKRDSAPWSSLISSYAVTVLTKCISSTSVSFLCCAVEFQLSEPYSRAGTTRTS
jgi:hypothetical protein